MGNELGRALLLADAVTPEGMARALLEAVRERVSLVRALILTGVVDPARLEDELTRLAPDVPVQRQPVPVLDLVERLPARLCEALVAVPVRRDPRTGTVDVALADAHDTHAADEIAFYLGAPVRVVRSPLAALEDGIARALSPRMQAPPSILPPAHTPPLQQPVRAAIVEVDAAPPEHPALVSERPMPLVKHSSDGPQEIPIPLSRRMVIPRITAQVDDDGPVVELRRSKTPSTQAMPAVRPEPAVPPAPVMASVFSPPPLHQLLREMARATARDPLMELVLQAIRPVAPKVALFAAKKEAYVGWMCTPEFGAPAPLSDVRIDARAPSVFATAASSGTFRGTLMATPAHASLLALLSDPSPEILAVAIRAAGKPVVIVLAHDYVGAQLTMSVMAEVAGVAGETLERIVLGTRAAAAPAKR